MKLTAKLGLGATIILGVAVAQAQTNVNLTQLLYSAPAATTAERSEFRNQLKGVDLLAWIDSIREYAMDPRSNQNSAKFKIAVILEAVADQGDRIPLLERSLANPRSSLSLIEFYSLLLGGLAIDSQAFKQFLIIQLGKECARASQSSTPEMFLDERDLCSRSVFGLLAEAAKSKRPTTARAARGTLVMLMTTYDVSEISGPAPFRIVRQDRPSITADFKRRVASALKSLRLYQNQIGE